MNAIAMNRICFVFLTLTVFSSGNYAQNWSANLTPEELAKEKSVLVEKYPGIFSTENILAIHKIKSDLSRIEYTFKGAYFEAFVNSGSKDLLLIETDQQIPIETAPAIVKEKALAEKDSDWKIDKIFKVSTPTGGDLYRVDVYKNDKDKMDHLYMDDKGMFRKAPSK